MPRFEITVVEATGLPSADLNGKSDPYLEVCTATERQKTKTIKETLNPVWRETKVVSIANPATDGVGFIVYDWDRFGANDIIAYGFISMFGLPPGGMPLDAWIALYKKSKKANKAQKKEAKKVASGKPPKPAVPGGRLHLVVRALDVPPMPMGAPMGAMPMGAPMPGQPMPGAYPPQPMPGQPMPGQPMPGQPMPGQYPPGAYPPQPMPGQPMPGQPMPGQYPPGAYPPQPMPGQPMPPMAAAPMGAPMAAAPMAAAPMGGPQPLTIQAPYKGAVPQGFQNKAGFLRPKKTDAEVAGHIAGKGAKKTLKFLGKALLS